MPPRGQKPQFVRRIRHLNDVRRDVILPQVIVDNVPPLDDDFFAPNVFNGLNG